MAESCSNRVETLASTPSLKAPSGADTRCTSCSPGKLRADARDLSGLVEGPEHVAGLERAASRRCGPAAQSRQAPTQPGLGDDVPSPSLQGLLQQPGELRDEQVGVEERQGLGRPQITGEEPQSAAAVEEQRQLPRPASGQAQIAPAETCSPEGGVAAVCNAAGEVQGQCESAGGVCASGRSGGKEPVTAGTLPAPAYLLLVIDGTWRQAKEMYKALDPRCLPPQGPGIQVALRPADVFPPPSASQQQPASSAASAAEAPSQPTPGPSSGNPEVMSSGPSASGSVVGNLSALALEPAAAATSGPDAILPQRMQPAAPDGAGLGSEADGGTGGRGAAGLLGPLGVGDGLAEPALDYHPEMPCLIRKEPAVGCLSTYEATVRALGLLERDPDLASELLAPLRLMTRLQAAFSPSVLSRMRTEPEPAKQAPVAEVALQGAR